ncbi:MAG: hypothetical protein LBI70_00635 [Rickettsiales bacterium]|jgi:hypothetical protein|nr:hypothetical protein [Rickettsiales bacterium]
MPKKGSVPMDSKKSIGKGLSSSSSSPKKEVTLGKDGGCCSKSCKCPK